MQVLNVYTTKKRTLAERIFKASFPHSKKICLQSTISHELASLIRDTCVHSCCIGHTSFYKNYLPPLATSSNTHAFCRMVFLRMTLYMLILDTLFCQLCNDKMGKHNKLNFSIKSLVEKSSKIRKKVNRHATLGWVVFRKSSPIKVCILWG